MLLALPVAVPILFWAAYHYHKDRHLPEPLTNLCLAFALGLLAAGTSQFLYAALEPLGLRLDAVELGYTDPLALLAYSLLAIGPIEEFAKLLPFLLVVIHWRAFDEPLDGIIYASFIGLGYAAVENVHYLSFLTPLEAWGRGFAGPVVHMLFASIWGHWVTSAKLSGKGLFVPALLGFAIAAGLHGIYDFLVLLQPGSALPIAAGLVVIVWVWRLRLMRRMHKAAVASGVLKV